PITNFSSMSNCNSPPLYVPMPYSPKSPPLLTSTTSTFISPTSPESPTTSISFLFSQSNVVSPSSTTNQSPILSESSSSSSPPVSPTSTYVQPLPSSAKKKGRPAGVKPEECQRCHKRYTPEWRKGENGIDLCNACGLKYIKKNKQAMLAKERHSLRKILNCSGEEIVPPPPQQSTENEELEDEPKVKQDKSNKRKK
ncbi:hypothetical protein SAMD00019534_027710, partial [Acytostelium subglobosum LB1]|uniref:hypothetical protein n=1 Tax=Acytostelium subglobosum LB1 TaxID=1410327 RepID=UPI000644F884